MKKSSIKTKIITTIGIGGICLCLVVGFVTYFYLSNILISDKLSTINQLGVEQAHESAQIFKSNQIFTEMIATRTRVKEYLLDQSEARRAELDSIFSDYAKANRKYLTLYLLNKDGVALISTDRAFVGQDYSFREYYKNAVNGKPSVMVLKGVTSLQFGYYFSYPVFSDAKEVIGVFVVKVDDREFSSSILVSEVAKNGHVMLVDEYGVILISDKGERVMKSLGVLSAEDKNKIVESKKFAGTEITPLQYGDAQVVIRDGRNQATIEFYDEEDGETEVIDINRLGSYPFYLVTETGVEAITDTVLSTIIILMSLIFMGVFVVSYIIFKLLTRLIQPLDMLKIFSESISKGDFNHKLDIKTKDEFGELADTFNIMSRDLGDLYSNLDKKVQEKTREIQSKNQETENQKLAILNILEDVELEKNKSDMLANDLEKFKLAVDNTSDQVVITDSDGIVIYGNQTVEKITGYTLEEALGKKAGALWKTPMPLEYYKNLWDVIKNKKKSFIGEIKNKRKNGELYIASISISPVVNGVGEIIYFVAIERDISKEKEIDKAKTEFVSLASHQLRTPLSSINWYTEMLLSGDAGNINENQKKYLNEVYQGSQRMVGLVNDLLNVSRLDLGTFVISPVLIEIPVMVKSLLLELKSQIDDRKQIVTESYSPDLKGFLGDQNLLRMVVQNLLSNAVKYTPAQGRVSVEVNTPPVGSVVGGKIITTGESILIRIADSGMGIPKSQQDKIFSKLFRADNAKESETEGTGLGLYIIKSIVDQASGDVWFESEENKGTTFYVTFPVSGMKQKERAPQLE